MASNDRLDQLKRQVRETSNQQHQLQAQKERAKEIISYREQEKKQNQQEMVQLIRSVFGQSELAAARDRELLQDKLDKFSHRQSVMNEQLITLNDNLTDMTSLKAVYEVKRQQLELDYQNQKDALQRQISSLNELLEVRRNDLERLESEIYTTQSQLDKIVIETKKATFLNELKKTWIDKWFIFAFIGFIALIIGGFAGWSIFSFFSLFANEIIEKFGAIFG